MDSVVVAHREAKSFSDRVALGMARLLRWGLDTASGYKHEHAVALNAKDPVAAQKKYGMTEREVHDPKCLLRVCGRVSSDSNLRFNGSSKANMAFRQVCRAW